MSITTYPVSGQFGKAHATTRRRTPNRTQAPARPSSVSAPKVSRWTAISHFLGDAMATWATGGRLPF